jgi:heme/copper-type cytochrome/quinol oxidase subunit 3
VSGYVASSVERPSKPAAWWGMVMLIASEATLFGAFIGTYFYLRFRAPQWPPAGIPEPRVIVPLILLAVLLTSSIPMHFATQASQQGRLAATRFFVLAALVLQAGYFGWAVHDFSDQLQTFDISRNAYSSIYYVLLGADHAHIALGLLFDLWLIWKLMRGLTRYRVHATEGIALYWHAVNVLTLIVTLTLLSAAIG